ncbi:MAG: glycosyltransferase family 4 protein [Verrucomicrobiales bacterium]|nr:glycosyltransferase family 4 protein [Verrucomicrobiales bacterium]
MTERPRLLITHPWMGRGGSEATAMWTLEAFQDDYEITFLTASEMNWSELNEAFGTKVDPDRITFIQAPRLPTVDGPLRLSYLQVRYFERFCRKFAPLVDCCISTYNPVQFGRPAMQLIGDFSFSEKMRKKLYIYGDDKFRHRETVFRKLYLALGKLISIPQLPLHEREDLILANSEWVAAQLEESFQVEDSPVIYPPVVLPEAPGDAIRDPLGFVCLGRIVPEKEIERIISILEMVRNNGFPITLRLIGKVEENAYGCRIRKLISDRDWIIPEGFLTLAAKQQILGSQTYALHACRIEAFGIAVAEMASMGCIPVVPDTGGAGEIIPYPELQFGTNEEACRKILTLLKSPGATEKIRDELTSRMIRFGPEVFKSELCEHLRSFTGLNKLSCHAITDQNLAATH